jgi:hypothetical protein
VAFGFAGFRWVPPDIQAEGVALYLLFCLRGALVDVLVVLAFPCVLSGLLVLPFGCLPTVLAFPCCVIGLLALPLCGAAPTFLCRRKEK